MNGKSFDAYKHLRTSGSRRMATSAAGPGRPGEAAHGVPGAQLVGLDGQVRCIQWSNATSDRVLGAPVLWLRQIAAAMARMRRATRTATPSKVRPPCCSRSNCPLRVSFMDSISCRTDLSRPSPLRFFSGRRPGLHRRRAWPGALRVRRVSGSPAPTGSLPSPRKLTSRSSTSCLTTSTQRNAALWSSESSRTTRHLGRAGHQAPRLSGRIRVGAAPTAVRHRQRLPARTPGSGLAPPPPPGTSTPKQTPSVCAGGRQFRSRGGVDGISCPGFRAAGSLPPRSARSASTRTACPARKEARDMDRAECVAAIVASGRVPSLLCGAR